MKPYSIPAAPVVVEQIVKRSQFICYIEHCPTKADADAFIRRINEKHPDANHNCWACVAGNPGDPAGYGMSDDGEPRGCAGKPMFNVLHHSGIGEICAVVSRYFGGIKLGTGGMARAYSSSVQLAMDQLDTRVKINYAKISLTLPYSLLKTTEHLISEVEGTVADAEYAADIQLIAEIPESMEELFQERIREASQGTILYQKD
ncbi:YigZ family protein [Desulfosediminicola ganghwensis]|uniref:YigZ family protein n=1 Tax=Desulfosediminicola ganghwensis TaxID=2569540 RepID=UPI0010AD000E|nr:YigZ family protein [Desulfosediminicola ganghwensis]